MSVTDHNARELPPTVAQRQPTAEQHAREVYSLGAEWQAYKWEAEGDRETGYLVLTGGVFRRRITRGKRKGEVNFKKPEPNTLRTLVIPNVLHRAWRAQWQIETGYCAECEGTGQSWAGWGINTGNRYRQCTKCNGSGVHQATEAAA